MQSPVAVSQIGEFVCWHCVFDVQPVWHWWSPQHAGIAAPQSALVAHARQRPSTQRGSVAGQSESFAHSTQPSVSLQIG
jgi:hypothetical protein